MNLCFNSVLTDVVNDSLTLSVKLKVVGDQTPLCGFYSRLITREREGAPVFDTLSAQPPSTGWQSHTLTFTKDELTDYILEFGFWASGAGTLAVDDFALQIDGGGYPEAVARSVPPLTPAFTAQLQDALIPLPTGDPDAPAAGYDWLRFAVGDAKIVLLGEGTHGTREFAEQRWAITRYLVEEMGFRTVALEANLPEADLLNQQLASATDPESLRELIDGLHFWMYRTEEFADFLRWVQDYNRARERPIEIRGVDMQHAPVALEELMRYARETADLPLLATLDSLGVHVKHPIQSITWAKRLPAHVAGAGSGAPADRMQRYAQVALQALTLKYAKPARSYRDERMAEHAAWLTERAENERVVIWAHNGHVQRTEGAMGDWLRQGPYGKELVIIGMTTGRGSYLAMDIWTRTILADELKPAPPESWEYHLQQSGPPAFFLDLRPLRPDSRNQVRRRMRSIGAIATPKQFFPADLGRTFDGLVYVDSSHAVTPY